VRHSLGRTAPDLVHSCPLPRHEAWALFEAATGRPRTFWLAHDDLQVDLPAAALFDRWTAKRSEGIPLAYLVGYREFYGRRFWVNRNALIPRSDTETLIDLARPLLRDARSNEGRLRLLDLGTGSGCIGITLLKECPGIEVHASEVSPAAAAVARNNAAWLGCGQDLTVHLGSWWQAFRPGLDEKFFAVVSNPPYIPEGDPHLGQGDLRYEPRLALSPGDGLLAYRSILAGIDDWLSPGGFLLVEHGYDQQAQLMALFSAHGLRDVQAFSDLSGTPRAVLAYKA